jgi:DNA-binding response OmpR family regulator
MRGAGSVSENLFENNSANKRVLLICRSANTLGALASILNKAGAIALTAQHAADAWEIMRSGPVTCVVQDLTNVTHDSFLFFRSCRSSRNTFGVPFLFLSTTDFIAPKFEGVWPETARDNWLPLPCPAHQFLSAIRSLIAANQPASGVASLPFSAPAQVSAPSASGAQPGISSTTNTAAMLASVGGKPYSSGVYSPAVNAANAVNALFSGKLGTLHFSQILGLIEPLNLTGVLKLFDGVRTGSVHFVDGKVFHAELNEIEGSEALFLLFHIKRGSFQFEVGPPTPRRTVEGNTMSLLLEGMRKMDEAKAMVSAIKERQNTGAYSSIVARTIAE